jgi:polyhydroxybutyrate depolymerase
VTERGVRSRRITLTALCALLALLVAGCGSTEASDTPTQTTLGPFTQPLSGFQATRETVKVADGLVRDYLLYLPPGGAKDSPLTLVYHGADATAEQAVGETDFVQAAAKDGSVVAFLQGYDDTWNEGAGDTPAHAAGMNDVEFTADVLHQIEQHHSIDPTRVAAAGFSNGALLAELLGCRLAGSLTLIVPIAGPLPVSVSPGCRPKLPISVLEMHGTADDAIPYAGGRFYGVGGGTTVLSAPASAARWAKLDGCRKQSKSSEASSQPAEITSYTGCREHVAVALRTLEGVGHGWPEHIGTLVAEFLEQHPRASRG